MFKTTKADIRIALNYEKRIPINNDDEDVDPKFKSVLHLFRGTR
jgi:hypothetical protein